LNLLILKNKFIWVIVKKNHLVREAISQRLLSECISMKLLKNKTKQSEKLVNGEKSPEYCLLLRDGDGD
jgi:hypothetical protein